mmetsp:Transcript_1372/g.2501  ORF Transcript_1372/g.2501 Transcript_1372/m.2501 type:complete len:225 (+) Transcript_1372:226-900(+)
MPSPTELRRHPAASPRLPIHARQESNRSACDLPLSITLRFLRFFTVISATGLIISRILPLVSAKGKDLIRVVNSTGVLSSWFIGVYKVLYHASFIMVEMDYATPLFLPEEGMGYLQRGFLYTFLGMLDLGVAHRDGGSRLDELFNSTTTSSTELTARARAAQISDVAMFLASRVLIGTGFVYMVISFFRKPPNPNAQDRSTAAPIPRRSEPILTEGRKTPSSRR